MNDGGSGWSGPTMKGFSIFISWLELYVCRRMYLRVIIKYVIINRKTYLRNFVLAIQVDYLDGYWDGQRDLVLAEMERK